MDKYYGEPLPDGRDFTRKEKDAIRQQWRTVHALYLRLLKQRGILT